MSLNDFFDNIYCINLDEATERLINCEEQAKKFEFTFERFSAIKPIDRTPTLLRGELGCLQSHLGVIRDAKEKQYKKILILEDDFVLVDNFNDLFFERIKFVPENWNFLYFGGNHIHGVVPINNFVGIIRHTYTTNAYCINDNMFDTIIGVLSPALKQVDVYYAQLQKITNAYVFKPHLAYQRNGYSYIQEGNVDYSFLK